MNDIKLKDSVAKMIDNDDRCGLIKYSHECNRVISNPVISGSSVYRAFCLKMKMLSNWDLSRLPFIIQTPSRGKED